MMRTYLPFVGLLVVAGSGLSAQPMRMDHSHEFVATPEGGRIVMQRDARAAEDSGAVAKIRDHIADIARRFTTGDFRLPPGGASAAAVPGTDVMTAKRDVITYAARPLARGAEVVITSRDPEAIKGVHAYLAFHEREHDALDATNP
jgi:hypothetical protein